MDTVKKARDNVKAFAPDDDAWKEVAAAMAQSADTLEQYWEGMLTQSHASCDIVAKADGNPDIVAALSVITQTGQNAAAGFIALADRWMADARACYRVDCDGMQSIWSAFCGDDWEEATIPTKTADAARPMIFARKCRARFSRCSIASRRSTRRRKCRSIIRYARRYAA